MFNNLLSSAVYLENIENALAADATPTDAAPEPNQDEIEELRKFQKFYNFNENEGDRDESDTESDNSSTIEYYKKLTAKYLSKKTLNSQKIFSSPEYRPIQNVFAKYNVIMPSSAYVERSFSIANDILSKKRRNLSDQNFENLMLLHD